MFGIGLLEVGVVLVVALLVIGPQKMPEAARTFAKIVRQVRATVAELKNAIDIEK